MGAHFLVNLNELGKQRLEFFLAAEIVESLAGDRIYDLMRQHGLNPKSKEDWDACVTEFKAFVPHVASKINLSF